MLCTALDTTARNQAEAQLTEYRSELWHVARVATAGEMAAVMAHEINQPLAAIAHTASACARMSAAGTIGSQELAEHLTEISAQARRASGIIKRVRRFVRKEPIASGPVDIDKVVDYILRMLLPWSKKKSIRIERSRNGRLQPVMGDEIQLGQLVLNLVRNALDAVMKNQLCDRVVVIAARNVDGKAVLLEVMDNGPGFRPRTGTKFSSRFSRRGETVWEWGCRLPAR